MWIICGFIQCIMAITVENDENNVQLHIKNILSLKTNNNDNNDINNCNYKIISNNPLHMNQINQHCYLSIPSPTNINNDINEK